jgi:hypothetical protein
MYKEVVLICTTESLSGLGSQQLIEWQCGDLGRPGLQRGSLQYKNGFGSGGEPDPTPMRG